MKVIKIAGIIIPQISFMKNWALANSGPGTVHCFNMFERNPKRFVKSFVIADKTEICETGPKEAKKVTSVRKIMAIVFWDLQSILFTNYLKKGRLITGQ